MAYRIELPPLRITRHLTGGSPMRIKPVMPVMDGEGYGNIRLDIEALAMCILAEHNVYETGGILEVWRRVLGITLDAEKLKKMHLNTLRERRIFLLKSE